MSVVNEAIQDGVAQSGIADYIVPMFDGDLAGDDGRRSGDHRGSPEGRAVRAD